MKRRIHEDDQVALLGVSDEEVALVLADMADDETVRRVEQAHPGLREQLRHAPSPGRWWASWKPAWPAWTLAMAAVAAAAAVFFVVRTPAGPDSPGSRYTIKGSAQLSAIIHAGTSECQPINLEDPAPCAWSPSKDALLFSYRPDEKLDTPFVGVVVAPLSGNGTARALELEPGQVSIRAPKAGPEACNDAHLCSFYEGRPALGSGKHRVQVILSRDQLDQPTLLGASLTGREDLKIIEFQLEVIP